MTNTPLPLNFYQAVGWQASLLGFYAGKHQVLPEKDLEKAVEKLTKAVENIIGIYGDYPDSTLSGLKQTIDPLFEPKEYVKKVYDVIKGSGEQNNRPEIIDLADSLYFIRRVFQQDKELLKQEFSDEINATEGEDFNEKLKNFAPKIQNIYKTHIVQISKMIETHGAGDAVVAG